MTAALDTSAGETGTWLLTAALLDDKHGEHTVARRPRRGTRPPRPARLRQAGKIVFVTLVQRWPYPGGACVIRAASVLRNA